MRLALDRQDRVRPTEKSKKIEQALKYRRKERKREEGDNETQNRLMHNKAGNQKCERQKDKYQETDGRANKEGE